jgi:preprotein translocase subunit YajC
MMGGNFMPSGIISMILLFAVFYFVLILPERKRQKKTKEMLENLTTGTKVVTRGGIVGEIINISGDELTIVSGPNRTKLTILRHAVGNLVDAAPQKIEEPKNEEVKSESAE